METNKKICRLHAIAPDALQGLWTQHHASRAAANPACTFGKGDVSTTPTCHMPSLSTFETVHEAQQGFSIELSLADHSAAHPGDVLFDARDQTSGRGVTLSVTTGGGFALGLSAVIFGETALTNESYVMDPACTKLLLEPGSQPHHVTVIADVGPLVILFLVDGRLCDGGGLTSQGWAFTKQFVNLNGATAAAAAPNYHGKLTHGALFSRALRVSEAVASHRALGFASTLK
jgi:hypothetical protein